MPKVLIIGRFHDDGMRLFEARPEVVTEIVDGSDEAEVTEKIRDADGVTIRTSPLPGHVLDRAERLKVVSRHGVGYDNIDVGALTRRRIPLAIAADANATAVAEHTLYFMLALAKQGLRYDRATREGRWSERNDLGPVDLLGRRVLVLGFGRIGREVARRCAAFGMAVMVHDPYVQANVIEAAGDYRSIPDWEAALPETDVLTVHLPLGPESRGLIGSEELAALPPHAFVINAARGGIVDEAALHAALTSGSHRGRRPRRLRPGAAAPGPPPLHPSQRGPQPPQRRPQQGSRDPHGDLHRPQRARRPRRQARPLDGGQPRGLVKARRYSPPPFREIASKSLRWSGRLRDGAARPCAGAGCGRRRCRWRSRGRRSRERHKGASDNLSGWRWRTARAADSARATRARPGSDADIARPDRCPTG